MQAVPLRRTAASSLGLLLCCAALFANTASAGSGQSSDYSIAVQVAYGKEVGPESLRQLLETEIMRLVVESGCFRAVARFDPEAEVHEADLHLRLVIQEVEDRTDYETSLAYRDRKDRAPDEKKKMISTLVVGAALQILTLPESAEVRRRDFKSTRRYRPEYDEDGTYEVKRIMLEHLADESRRFACKGAGQKLAKEVERARAASRP